MLGKHPTQTLPQEASQEDAVEDGRTDGRGNGAGKARRAGAGTTLQAAWRSRRTRPGTREGSAPGSTALPPRGGGNIRLTGLRANAEPPLQPRLFAGGGGVVTEFGGLTHKPRPAHLIRPRRSSGVPSCYDQSGVL